MLALSASEFSSAHIFMGVKCVVHKLNDLLDVNLLRIEIDKDAPISGSVPVPISSISTNEFLFEVLVISDIFFI